MALSTDTYRFAVSPTVCDCVCFACANEIYLIMYACKNVCSKLFYKLITTGDRQTTDNADPVV